MSHTARMAKHTRAPSSAVWWCRKNGIFRSSLGLALAVGTVLVGRSVQASCTAPPSSILWSQPADGATNVPTNVVLWVLPVSAGELEVSLDGAKLAASADRFSYELGELAPNTTYTVAFDFGGRVLPVHFEQSFSTGSGPADAQPAAAPGAVTASRQAHSEWPRSDFCDSVLWAQGCYDTGQDTHFLFEPEGSATAWLIREDDGPQGARVPVLWPAECGTPNLFAHSSEQPCVTLSGIDRAGILHKGQSVCAPEVAVAEPAMAPPIEPPPPLDVTTSPSAASSATASPHVGGCSLRTSPTSCTRPLLGALLVLALAVSRRRSAPAAHAR